MPDTEHSYQPFTAFDAPNDSSSLYTGVNEDASTSINDTAYYEFDSLYQLDDIVMESDGLPSGWFQGPALDSQMTDVYQTKYVLWFCLNNDLILS